MMTELSATDQAILAQQSMSTLAHWWCELNSFRWPPELPDHEPSTYVEGGRRSKLMDWIGEAIGYRAISREWNKDMTEEEFNDFWRGFYEGHQPSRERHRERIRQRIKKPRG